MSLRRARQHSSSPNLAEQLAPLAWSPDRRLVLASASPQRQQILRDFGVEFEARPTHVDELSVGDPDLVALSNARAKAEAGRAALSEAERDFCVVLAADTVVALGGTVYGKPRDAAQARQYLTELSSAAHQVIGAIVVIDVDGVARETLVCTEVAFRNLSADEISSQVARGEWQDRAGGYAIQLSGDEMVAEIGADRLNVVGLSIVALGGLVQGLLPAGSVAPDRYTD